MSCTSEPGNVHHAFDDDSDQFEVPGNAAAALDEPEPDQALAAELAENEQIVKAQAAFADLRQRMPHLENGAMLLPPAEVRFLYFVTNDGAAYCTSPNGNVTKDEAIAGLRRMADVLAGEESVVLCKRCFQACDPHTEHCPRCDNVAIDPLDDDQQPPAPMEPCS